MVTICLDGDHLLRWRPPAWMVTICLDDHLLRWLPSALVAAICQMVTRFYSLSIQAIICSPEYIQSIRPRMYSVNSGDYIQPQYQFAGYLNILWFSIQMCCLMLYDYIAPLARHLCVSLANWKIHDVFSIAHLEPTPEDDLFNRHDLKNPSPYTSKVIQIHTNHMSLRKSLPNMSHPKAASCF